MPWHKSLLIPFSFLSITAFNDTRAMLRNHQSQLCLVLRTLSLSTLQESHTSEYQETEVLRKTCIERCNLIMTTPSDYVLFCRWQCDDWVWAVRTAGCGWPGPVQAKHHRGSPRSQRQENHHHFQLHLCLWLLLCWNTLCAIHVRTSHNPLRDK